jgi:co-chaperonin GroES (HSP10)
MVNEKQDPANIKPFKGFVKVEISLPKNWKTAAGIHLIPNRDTAFKEISHYEGALTGIGKDCPPQLVEGAIYRVDKFAGTAMPTTGDKLIKVMDHTLLLGRVVGEKAADYVPHWQRMLIRVTSLREKTESGIISVGNNSSIFDMDVLGGEVIAVSPDMAEEVSVGDSVIWERHAGVEMKFENIDYISVPRYSLLAKVTSPQ